MLKDKKNIAILSLSVLCAALLVAVIAVSFGKNNNSNSTTMNENSNTTQLSIINSTENNEWIEVETSYITFRYPSAFSDIIRVEAINTGDISQLRFTGKLEDKLIDIYSIHFNNEEGAPCGVLTVNKNEISVTVDLEAPPENLSADWLTTFNAVQETFNDVLISMSENDNFKIAE